MLVFVFILMLIVRVMVVIVGQIVADRTACCAPKSRTNQTTCGATHTVADHLSTSGPKTSANG